ncbi:MAG: hypothetical protein CME30_00300 [Gemmatimonadetes bacterium]|nr:hypothetical protein [Gemmatimonadota bacterium]
MNMRNILTTLFLSASIASPGTAQDLTGTWEISTQGGRVGPQTMTLVVIQEGQDLTGTLTRTVSGRGQGRAVESDVENGVIEGKSFSFRVSQSTEGMPPAMRDRIGGNSFSQSFSGTIDGGSMEGTIMGIRGQGRPFSGQRKD